MSTTTQFKYVSYLWNEEESAKSAGDEVALLLYRSNLLGADLRITNYGGGNTSCKVIEKDPLTGENTEVMYVKGSGGDIGTLKRSGLAGLYLDKLTALKKIYRGLKHEDEMVALFNHCIFDLNSKAPSIDTPLHAFLPFNHIDHLHPDAAIAIAACKDGKKINEDLFEGKMGWVDWQRPGFDLGLKLEQCLKDNPGIRGIMLGGHGLFTWGETSYESYMNTLEVIEKYSEYVHQNFGKSRPVFGGVKITSIPKEKRMEQASKLAPVLRGFCSSETLMIGHFTDEDRVLEFINSKDVERLAKMGTSCPDHFLRTKICPLVLHLAPDENLEEVEKLKEKLTPTFEDYRSYYKKYYEEHKHPDSPAMRDPNPVVILYPGVGMFTFAKNKQTARVASEFYINAINVMKGAEAVSEYVSLPLQEAFDIEYWLLEEAKLQRLPKPKPLSGKISLVTGSGGGIGKAIARRLIKEGACVVIADIMEERLDQTAKEFEQEFSKDTFITVKMDVAKPEDVAGGFRQICIAFGGIDIAVNNAGLSVSKPLTETSLDEWDLLQNVLVKGQFIISREAVNIMKKQGLGGDIVDIVSKNALVSGPNNVGYGSAKAAQLHMSRLMAAELGSDHIRVNIVNPDAVIQGSNIWAGGWAEGRAKAYNISVEDLPRYYAGRTLLNETILPGDVANAVFVFVSGLLNKSTGNVLNVDGGVAAAFVR
ncbi:MAG: bifunctional aldolase/short-chain dehydrogenase [Chitinophagaceae bacterium]|nr:MAG: bifunctional aldolase/short-chain dehydrogenase [Chitinophagaceae bacterium]